MLESAVGNSLQHTPLRTRTSNAVSLEMLPLIGSRHRYELREMGGFVQRLASQSSSVGTCFGGAYQHSSWCILFMANSPFQGVRRTYIALLLYEQKEGEGTFDGIVCVSRHGDKYPRTSDRLATQWMRKSRLP